MATILERWFRLRENGTTVRTEVAGGITTFMTMAYIVFVNPAILAQAGMDFGAVMTATCLAAGIATWAMGIAANYPIALAPAMGQNVFFLTVVAGMGVRWETALAAVFLSGAIFFLLTLCRIRGWILDAVPEGIKHAIAVGIGLFIAFLGLVGAGIIEKPAGPGLLRLGDLSRAPTLVALAGLLVAGALLARGIRSGVLAGILVSAGLAWTLGLVEWQGLVAAPPSLAPTFLRLDLVGVLDPALLPIVLLFLFMAMFDAIGTLIGVGEQGGFLRDGRLPRATPALLADSSGTVVGSLLGTSTVTAYVESATGVQAGARTGLGNLATGSLFFLALLFSPLVRMIGGGVEVAGGGILQPVTAPALIVVGCLMAGNVRRIDWSDFTEAFPAFLVLAGIPFTGSIADGIAFGLIGHPVLKALSGRARQVHPLAYALGAVFLLRYLFL